MITGMKERDIADQYGTSRKFTPRQNGGGRKTTLKVYKHLTIDLLFGSFPSAVKTMLEFGKKELWEENKIELEKYEKFIGRIYAERAFHMTEEELEMEKERDMRIYDVNERIDDEISKVWHLNKFYSRYLNENTKMESMHKQN
jgi:hypothetical protein